MKSTTMFNYTCPSTALRMLAPKGMENLHTGQLVLITLVILFAMGSCVEKQKSTTKYVYTKGLSFTYNLERYKIKYKHKSYVILINEYDYYSLLKSFGRVENQKDYFLNKLDLLNNSLEFDSITFSNFKSQTVFVDSCDQAKVEKWVKKIKSNKRFLNHPLIIDSSLNIMELNNIYYRLICDSFKIYQEDVSGNYILSR